ncbi:MAG: carbohydrate-binding protein [Paludibacteraceae bacterium]|nr:carbohydrate-binding protein [Paludibacteraceae bacterium]
MHKSAKRGVAFSFSRLDDAMLLSPHISWFYNWGPDFRVVDLDTWFGMENVDFLPMAWNGGYDENRIKTYVTGHPNCKYLLAYNEPNLNDQAHMTPEAAAEKWPRLKALADELQLKIVSPAMNYGTLEGYHDPIKWLDEFFDLVPLSDVDAIAVHCYMSSPSGLENYVERFSKYGKPVWMTEFCAWDPEPSDVEIQLSYMCTVLNWMEQTEQIERYAWFIPRTGRAVDTPPYMQLLTHTSPSELTEAGRIYTAFSSFDKSVWLDASRSVSAHNYTALSSNSIQIRSCPDTTTMMIKNLSEGDWVEYQVFVPDNASDLQVSYASPVNCSIAVYIDGEIYNFAEMQPSVSDMSEWSICNISLDSLSGKHTVRLLVGKGSFNMKWIKIT